MSTPRRLVPVALIALVSFRLAAAAEFDVEAALRRSLGQKSWYGVYMANQKCGYALAQCLAVKAGGRDAVSITLDMHMKVTALGRQQEMQINDGHVFLRTGELHAVSSQFKTGASNVETAGTVQGDKLVITVRTGDVTRTQELPKPKSSLRDALAAMRLVAPDAKIGDQVTAYEFVPMVLKELESVLTLKERKQIIFNGVPTQVSVIGVRVPSLGVTAQMFVDENGDLIEQTVGSAFVLRLEPEQVAKDIRYSTDLLRMGCVPLLPPPRHPARLTRLRLEVRGIDEPGLLLDDARQHWTKQPDGSYIVDSNVPPVEPGRVARLPVDRAKFGEDLAPSVLVQSDDPRIRALAVEIVGKEADAYAAAKKINRWVFANLRKRGTAALSNAVETLLSREGDCTEHTVLFVALARAAGIPARECAGLTAVEGGEGLYYHAWPEVWVGDWVAMDPTLGQDLADATHIKFLQGGGEQFLRVIAIFGRLRAKPLGLEPNAGAEPKGAPRSRALPPARISHQPR